MSHLLTEIPPLDKEIGQKVRAYIDTLTKPLGSLGRLEGMAIQLAEMTSDEFPVVTPPGVIVFAADHGVVEEGVSAYPQEVTVQMVMNFLNRGAAINVFSKQIGAAFEVVDVGVAQDICADGVVNQKVRYGTANFYKQDAMTREEADKAIAVGYGRAEKMIQQGSKCLILGEMGIGNTTASSAVLAVLSGQSIDKLVGRGTGIDSGEIPHKQEVIVRAIEARKPDRNDPIDVLAKVGGLEMAAITGAMLAGASHRIPILVDGFICTVAALLAKEICSHASEYMIVGHRSVEPGHDIALQLLGKQPILDLGMRLGEGSGAAVAFPILQSATLMLKEMATFTSAGISKE
ncbi:nicotinate-nucleotide--dimethylbenzimidazole phosphoribosyltransferase [Bacillus canaveralius]|uniref:Nicotinate-nucleotide--dimethylbenzimidazole phosphoribosyltransferase n=1 Tax=Bacillus canaveralius TaxID=1403243 RepID=A0A2N5GI01_9BACI|nr:nicotinate-nucleotide--dimethylbenzimidazole phosphoribosyltransferase [Bacillus canaveralius]PLR80390.1 nicotinate-nucleotide--dimethylbenzimidazole phosphoribosyltransferase [Bacillus canaveralius]PLR88855.1 nicotinate-nucleotide--dimethylbenzimidazole phosphoribosyltransferase [Bacillus canaveralius]